MNKMEYFFWLMEQSLSGVIYAWPISFLIVMFFVLALVLNNPYSKKNNNKRASIVWLQLVLIITVLIVGTLLKHESTGTNPIPVWPQYLIVGLLFAHIPIAGYIIYSLKGFRLFAVSASILQAYITFWATFISGMSITGDWL